MHLYKNICHCLNRWIEYLLAVMGLSMALLVAVQVFSRYVLNHSIFWSEELARYLLVWLTFLGATVAYYRGVHPGIDVLYSRLKPPVRQLCDRIVHLISILFFGVMIIYGFRFAYFIRLQVTPALALPKWVVFAIIPISGSMLLLYACLKLAEDGGGEAS